MLAPLNIGKDGCLQQKAPEFLPFRSVLEFIMLQAFKIEPKNFILLNNTAKIVTIIEYVAYNCTIKNKLYQ